MPRVQHMQESTGLRRLLIRSADIQSGDSVLLVGCGHADTAQAVLDAVGPDGEVVVVDRDRDALKVLLDRFGEEATSGRLELIQRDVNEGWGFHYLRFDRILSHNVMEYIHAPWKLMAGMYRSLRPGGLLILSQCDFTSIRFGQQHELTSELVDRFCQRRRYWMGSTDASGRRLEQHFHESAFGTSDLTDFTERDAESGRLYAEALAFSGEQSPHVDDEKVAAWKKAVYDDEHQGFAVDTHVFIARRG